jgi:catechol 2,3-dioxygenase-like lactoylglutathione lyase family enzyme
MTATPSPSVVLFVANVAAIAEFYRTLADMTVVHAAPDHVLLEIAGLQLVVHALHGAPPAVEDDAGSVAVREDAYFKLCLPVARIAAARAQALAMGGAIGPVANEWQARGFRACDGHDPEGNVIQVREAAA